MLFFSVMKWLNMKINTCTSIYKSSINIVFTTTTKTFTFIWIPNQLKTKNAQSDTTSLVPTHAAPLKRHFKIFSWISQKTTVERLLTKYQRNVFVQIVRCISRGRRSRVTLAAVGEGMDGILGVVASHRCHRTLVPTPTMAWSSSSTIQRDTKYFEI